MKKVEPLKTKFCRFLRAKNTFGSLEGGDNNWFTYDDANTIFWCIKSTGAGGPDNGPVGQGMCTPGRSCYKGKD